MIRPMELDVIDDANNRETRMKALIDLDDVSFVCPVDYIGNMEKYCRFKFKGHGYVLVAMPYSEAKALIVGSRVNDVMFEESHDEQRPQPVPAGPRPAANAHVAELPDSVS